MQAMSKKYSVLIQYLISYSNNKKIKTLMQKKNRNKSTYLEELYYV